MKKLFWHSTILIKPVFDVTLESFNVVKMVFSFKRSRIFFKCTKKFSYYPEELLNRFVRYFTPLEIIWCFKKKLKLSMNTLYHRRFLTGFTSKTKSINRNPKNKVFQQLSFIYFCYSKRTPYTFKSVFYKISAFLLATILKFMSRKQQRLVTFVFDDSNVTDYTVMKPVFDAKGAVAVSAVTTDFVGLSGRLNWTQIKELVAAGWEIASHTKTHPSLTRLTEAQIRDELSGSRQAIEAQGIKVTNFVYPYHDHNETVRKITAEYYRSARGERGINLPVLKTYALRSIHADDHAKLEIYKRYVDIAAGAKMWLIFFLHATNSNNVAAIGELIDYIKLKNVPIVTMDKALDLIGNVNGIITPKGSTDVVTTSDISHAG